MARMLDEFETRQKAEEKRREEVSEKRRKENFIKKWVSASPEEQAEILWNIMTQLENASEMSRRLTIEHMRF